MKAWINAAAFMAIMAMSPALWAQWPLYPTPDVPRTPDDEVDLDAPAPRTADGRPDFSGLWSSRGSFGGGGFGGGQESDEPPEGPPVAGFRDVAQNMEGGLPLQPWAADVLEERRTNGSRDNPEAHCLPMGIVQFHTQGAPRKFVQVPGLIVILYEASSGIRQIFTDGRGAPDNDPQPWWYGYSAGSWVGDTLVVETTGFRDGGWLDIWGSPRTDAATITERYRRVSYGRMEIDITVDDPKAYTEPFTVRVNQEIMVDQDLIEFICLENQRFGTQ